MLRDACVCVRNNHWPPRRGEHSGVLIGIGGTWLLIGLNAGRLLVCARVAIDCTRTGTSDSSHLAATLDTVLRHVILCMIRRLLVIVQFLFLGDRGTTRLLYN